MSYYVALHATREQREYTSFRTAFFAVLPTWCSLIFIHCRCIVTKLITLLQHITHCQKLFYLVFC